MTRKEVLTAAETMVTGNRQDDYGTPENNFQVIAEFWSIYLGYHRGEMFLDAKDVAAMLALLKIARISSGHGKTDNWVDLAGYAACGGEIQGRTLGAAMVPKTGMPAMPKVLTLEELKKTSGAGWCESWDLCGAEYPVLNLHPCVWLGGYLFFETGFSIDIADEKTAAKHGKYGKGFRVWQGDKPTDEQRNEVQWN